MKNLGNKNFCASSKVTFSEKTTTTEYLATMEKDPSSIETEENSQFLNMNTSKKLAFYNHTEGVNKQYSYRLSGSSTEVVGPAKSMEVNPGDVVDLEVYARYANLTSTNSSVNTLLSSLISAFSLSSSGGSGLTGEDAYNSFGTIFSGGPFIGPGDYEDEDAPKAYLNYILFDEEFIPVDFGFDQISENAATAHEYLSLHVKVQQKGYLYIYLSNENNKLVDVFFDDLKVIHYTGVEQSDDYYAFGLNFNSYQRENSTKNKFKFQGQEHIDDLDLGWDSFKWRNHMPDIGRFFNVDPLSEKYYYNSPFAFSENKVVSHRELEGLESQSIHDDGTFPPSSDPKQNAYKEPNGQKRMWDAFGKAGEVMPGKIATLTDLNDAYVVSSTILGNDAKNLDGTDASNLDKGFAAAGLFLPLVSGSAVNKILKRLGSGPESAESLAEQAAKVEDNGFGHGVSTLEVDKLQKSDLQHRVADKKNVESTFEVKDTPTKRNPNHKTVILPKPVTNEVADQFNNVFVPPSLRKK